MDFFCIHSYICFDFYCILAISIAKQSSISIPDQKDDLSKMSCSFKIKISTDDATEPFHIM